MDQPIRVTIWNEFIHEKRDQEVIKHYPEGIHIHLKTQLEKEPDIRCKTAFLEAPEHGLTDQVLNNTDALIWWGHLAHDQVEDRIVDRVQQRILDGMGLVVLHSAHFSKIFQRMLGTECALKWREAGEKERLWNVEPSHPITHGIKEYIDLPQTEMYGERFDIPTPDKVVFISWFQGGEVFRSGCCWERGYGRIFYFRPGHETYPIYHHPEILRVIINSVRWARSRNATINRGCRKVKPIEKIP